MIPPHIKLMGGLLPPRVEYLGVEETLNLLQTEFAGLPKGGQKTTLIGILDYLINCNLCQAFLLEEIDWKGGKTSIPHEVPYPCVDNDGDSRGMHKVSFDLRKQIICCGKYSGRLAIPREHLMYAIDAFKQNHLSDEDKQHVRIGKLKAINSKMVSLEGRKKRVEIIRELIEQTKSRAEARNIPFDAIAMPGIKLDLTNLLRRRFPDEFKAIADDTFHGYYRDCGLEFRRGSRSNPKFWAELFPEYC